MPKSKWSVEFRTKVAQEYLDSKGSFQHLANKYHIGCTTIKKWVSVYNVHGLSAFISEPGNASYTRTFKTMCVEEVPSGKGSSVYVGAKYKVHPTVLPEQEKENIKLAELIKEYDERFNHILGYRRMTSWINHFNHTNYSLNRVHRIMKKLCICHGRSVG